MRLFTGISLPEATLLKIDRVLRDLRPLAKARWSPVHNLHITVKFIGEFPEERLPELIAALQAVRSEPFEIRIGSFGWFPGVLWAGVDAGDKLISLAGQTDSALEPIGVEREKRPYTAHLTLARTKAPIALAALRREIDTLRDVEIDAFPASSFHLYRSQAGVYTRLQTFPLE